MNIKPPQEWNRTSLFTSTAVAGVVAAAALAGTAAWVAGKARHAERDFPPIGGFVEVDGVRLHYIEKGSGEPIVLVHGNVVRLQDFMASGLVDRLAERYRVIAFDRPGFGYSDRPRDRLWTAQAQAELLREAFSTLGIERPIVLGHSWGALVALALGLDENAAVRQLILVSGYYYPTVRLDVPIGALPAIPLIGDVMRYTVSAVFARLLLKRTIKTMFSPQAVPPNFLPVLAREMIVRPQQLRANAEDAALMIPAAASLRKRYSELTMPVTILAGAADKIVDPERHARELHRELPNGELHILPDVGHMAHHFGVEQILAAIKPARVSTGVREPALAVT